MDGSMDGNTRVKILVVDDRQENLLTMDKLLSPLGANIHLVDSGEKALSEVLSHHFAVILMDVQMPGMDGFETATLLHSNKQTAHIPIIFISAINKDQAYISKGYQAGAVDYLPKPINPDILLGKVQVFLQLEEQRLELEEVSKQLRWISRKNKLLLDCAAEGIAGLDVYGRITFINPTACAMLEGTEDTLLGEHISRFLYEADGEGALGLWRASEACKACLQKGGTYRNSDLLWRQSGGSFPVEYNMGAIVNDRNIVQGAVLVFQDITERKALEDQLLQMAKYDSLTGLANRTLFREFLSASLGRSQGSENNTSVMYLDLDQFKEINDTLGHEAGDNLLINVADRLQESVRQGDIVARLGGDEFAIVLDDLPDPGDAPHVAEKILTKLKEPFDLTGTTKKIGVSIGIATASGTDVELDDLLKAADEAMYSAKKEGRNRYHLAPDVKKASRNNTNAAF